MSQLRLEISGLRVWLALALAASAAVVSAQSQNIPIVSGLNIVLAVANGTSSEGGPAGVLQGDYELVVSLISVTTERITHQATFEGTDAAGVQRRGTVVRPVSSADLASAPLQIFGFHLEDPPAVNGTTALGPSLAVVRTLAQKGVVPYSFKLWASARDAVTGTLRRSSESPVTFPVLLDGKRVELDAILATGHMGTASGTRPFETVILDHPRYPLSLRIAYGPRDGRFPFTPDFVREIVRIDRPASAVAFGESLEKECRVELRGLYFDFNRATLQPQSGPALKEIADLLGRARRDVRIEGHTDSIGTDRYNDDLSARRATAVKTALVRDYGVDEAWLSTAGVGERRPVESNDSLSGRARNRRVELVCAEIR